MSALERAYVVDGLGTEILAAYDALGEDRKQQLNREARRLLAEQRSEQRTPKAATA